MKILFQIIHRIDYKNNLCSEATAPEEMQIFVTNLLDYVLSNKNVQAYRGREESQVIRQAKIICQIAENGTSRGTKDWTETAKNNANTIAERLLLTEAEVQRKLQPTGQNVQDGSLVQALICEDSFDTTYYLVAKVAHDAFFDGKNYSLREGFSANQKNVWKSCILEISKNVKSVSASIYCNREANYWSNSFLELDQVKGNAHNTQEVFKAIDGELRRFFARHPRKITKNPKAGFQSVDAQYDYMIIYNILISRLKKRSQLDYAELISDILDHYQSDFLTEDRRNLLKSRLLALEGFDKNFLPDPKYIDTPGESRYSLGNGITLSIQPESRNLREMIIPCTKEGYHYLMIRVTNQDSIDDIMDEVSSEDSFVE